MKFVKRILGSDLLWKIVHLLSLPFGILEAIYTRLKTTLPASEIEKRSRPLQGCELYHFEGSPFSWRVRRALIRLQVRIPMHDILASDRAFSELIAGGKRDMCPCLKITEPGKPSQWMYHSRAIVKYLEDRVNFRSSTSA